MKTDSLQELATPRSLLFIEDNPHKRSRIVDFLTERAHEFSITEALSFTSGSKKLETEYFDLILADVSLPTFDKTLTDSGGRFRAFGGLEIARKLARSQTGSPIAFITQYRSFSEKGTSYSFEELKEELSQVCGNQFLGMVFYDASLSAWKDQLNLIISQASKKYEDPNS